MTGRLILRHIGDGTTGVPCPLGVFRPMGALLSDYRGGHENDDDTLPPRSSTSSSVPPPPPPPTSQLAVDIRLVPPPPISPTPGYVRAVVENMERMRVPHDFGISTATMEQASRATPLILTKKVACATRAADDRTNGDRNACSGGHNGTMTTTTTTAAAAADSGKKSCPCRCTSGSRPSTTTSPCPSTATCHRRP